MKKPLRHIFDYIILCILFSISLLILIYFNGNPKFQIPVVIISSLLYVFWGYFHHKKDNTINPKTIAEYAIYGLLGGILIVGLL